MDGTKDDEGKVRWDLMPFEHLEGVAKVLTFGAKKYAPENWRKVPDGRARYFAALMRHLVAWFKGEGVDPETGLSHLDHALCCLIFLKEFDKSE